MASSLKKDMGSGGKDETKAFFTTIVEACAGK
jgi:hypothetical protein